MSSGAHDDGTSVLRATLATARDSPRLLVFPVFAVVATIVVFPLLLWSITRSLEAAGTALVSVVPLALPVVLAPVLYLAIAASIAVLSSLVAFANVGVAQLTSDRIQGRPVTVRSGVAAALRQAPTVLFYGVFAGLVGLLGVVMERRSGSRGRYAFAALAGETYAAMTYLLAPVAVGENLSSTGTLYRGARLLRDRFGDHPVLSFTILENVTIVAALPLVAVQTLLLAEVFGNFGLFSGLPGDALVFVVGFSLVVLWSGVVFAMALAAIAKTALYVAIVEETDDLPLLGIPVDEAVTVKSTREVPNTETSEHESVSTDTETSERASTSPDTETSERESASAGAEGDADD